MPNFMSGDDIEQAMVQRHRGRTTAVLNTGKFRSRLENP